MGQGRLYVPAGSRIARFAEAAAWLWRLGPLLSSPSEESVAIGWHEDAEELDDLVRTKRVRGAVIFTSRPGPETGCLPSRARLIGVADFGDGARVTGQFSVLHGGDGYPAIQSSLGVHATRNGNWMVMAVDPETCWGGIDGFWLWPALADFLSTTLRTPLVMLPPIGLVRYDDVPGTAYHQRQGRAKPDKDAARRAERVVAAYRAAGSTINVAISSRAFIDGQEVFLDQVWPEAVRAFAGGVEDGSLEPICHGYLHLEAEALARGEIDPHEFALDGSEEAARKIDTTLEWIRKTMGVDASTFVAPNWAYGAGLLEALRERKLPAWLPPAPSPLLSGIDLRETLFSTLEGLHQLDYAPLECLAGAGFPPTVVMHGGLLDQRMERLKASRDLGTAARLAFHRDIFRLPRLKGVRWVGSAEMLARIQAHDKVEVEGDEVRTSGQFETLILRNGAREPALAATR